MELESSTGSMAHSIREHMLRTNAQGRASWFGICIAGIGETGLLECATAMVNPSKSIKTMRKTKQNNLCG